MKTIVTDIPDYRTFYTGKRTLELGYPWLTFGAIMAIEQILRSGKDYFRILEMGSGGSTIFFSKRCKYLLSLEHDLNWASAVGLFSMPNVKQICDSIPGLLKIIQEQKDGDFDLILADGGSSYRERKMLMDAAIPKLKKGGWLVIDNYMLCPMDYTTGWDVYTFDMFRYSGRGTRLCKKL